MAGSQQFLVFRIEDERYAIGLEPVGRVFRAVAVTPLPQAPAGILGVINVQGLIIPVINLRRRFRLPEKEIVPADQMIVVQAAERPFALVADEVLGVADCPPQATVAAEQILPRLQGIEGIVKLADGLVLIQDIGTLLPAAEAIPPSPMDDGGALQDG